MSRFALTIYRIPNVIQMFLCKVLVFQLMSIYIFLYGLFNDTVSACDDMASNDKKINEWLTGHY
jgi:hypothetical protein